MGSISQSVTFLTCEYPPFPGGIATYAGALVEILRSRGHATQVIAPAYDAVSDQVPDGPDTHRLLEHHKIVPGHVPRIAKLVRAMPTDTILHCADIRSAMLAYVLSPLHRRHYRIGIHGSEVSKLTGSSPLLAIARRAYANAEMITANSRDTLDLFMEATGYAGKARVANLGTDRQWFEPSVGPFENADLAALPSENPLFCCVGRVERRKGQIDAVRALVMARQRYGLAMPVLVVAGYIEDNAYAREVKAAAAESELQLVMTGRLSLADIKRLYARSLCHFLLAQNLPGRREGFGLVLTEAAALGCPSIAARVGGIPEALGSSGAAVAPGDIGAAAAAAATLAADPQCRTKAGEAAQAHAKTFTWLACAAATFPELNLA